MKPEIQQVLKMNKEGTLTDEQAAELLSELAQAEADARAGARSDWRTSEIVKPVVDKMNHTLKKALDATLGGGYVGSAGSAFAGDIKYNASRMSQVDSPDGEDFRFQRNTIRMSSMKGLRLERADLQDNTIDMSKVDKFSLKGGRFVGSEIRASSVEDWLQTDSEVSEISLVGSKVHDFRTRVGCNWLRLKVQGCSLKDISSEDHVVVRDLIINGASLSDIKILRSDLAESEIQASQFSDVSFTDCRIANTLWRGMNVKKSQFTRCDFDDVLFSGLETWGWKKRGIDDSRWESCRFDKVLFANCRMSKTIFKNLHLTNQKFQDLDLSGLTLDGNDAFNAALLQSVTRS